MDSLVILYIEVSAMVSSGISGITFPKPHEFQEDLFLGFDQGFIIFRENWIRLADDS